jgi:hypothetical protein
VTALPGGYAPVIQRSYVAPDDPDGPGLMLSASSGGRIQFRVVGADGKGKDGIQLRVRPQPDFPGSMMALIKQPVRPRRTAATPARTSWLPAPTLVTVENHPDVAPVTVPVSEGGVANATLTVP